MRPARSVCQFMATLRSRCSTRDQALNEQTAASRKQQKEHRLTNDVSDPGTSGEPALKAPPDVIDVKEYKGVVLGAAPSGAAAHVGFALSAAAPLLSQGTQSVVVKVRLEGFLGLRGFEDPFDHIGQVKTPIISVRGWCCSVRRRCGRLGDGRDGQT